MNGVTKHLIPSAIGMLLCACAVHAQTPPKMKMTTDIPPEITTPGSYETRLGTLNLFDGFPDDATTQKVYDNLDFQRGVQAFLNAMPGAALTAFRPALRKLGGVDGNVIIFEELMDSKALWLTPIPAAGLQGRRAGGILRYAAGYLRPLAGWTRFPGQWRSKACRGRHREVFENLSARADRQSSRDQVLQRVRRAPQHRPREQLPLL